MLSSFTDADLSGPQLPVSVRVVLTPEQIRRTLEHEVRDGLTSPKKWLTPKWFYDDRGSLLFDEITRLDEYYLTRCETEILEGFAEELAALTNAETVVELGSGTSSKTRTILSALHSAGTLERFCPLDVSEGILRSSGQEIAATFGVVVDGVVGDFEHHLDELPSHDSRLWLFLGSTIGNLSTSQREQFFKRLSDAMSASNWLLIGFDLVKPIDRLVTAYNDADGVTAEFNRNVLRVLNNELSANFHPERFDHRAHWNANHEWMEMHLISTCDQAVRLSALDLEIVFARGESIHTEISTKFHADRLVAELAVHGLTSERVVFDSTSSFAVALLRKEVGHNERGRDRS